MGEHPDCVEHILLHGLDRPLGYIVEKYIFFGCPAFFLYIHAARLGKVRVVINFPDPVGNTFLKILVADPGSAVHHDGNADAFPYPAYPVKIQLWRGQIQPVHGAE